VIQITWTLPFCLCHQCTRPIVCLPSTPTHGAHAAAGAVTPQLTPPPAPPSACLGCVAGSCFLVPLTSSYNCTKCQGNLLLSKSGSCSCPAGTFGTTTYTNEPECTDCPKGSYCPGGNYTAPRTPKRKSCDTGGSPTTAGLTTAGRRARRITACGKPEACRGHILPPCMTSTAGVARGMVSGSAAICSKQHLVTLAGFACQQCLPHLAYRPATAGAKRLCTILTSSTSTAVCRVKIAKQLSNTVW
jgi:hypothetical protein